MLDVHLPTTDGKQLVLTCYTQPEREHKMLLNQMKLNLLFIGYTYFHYDEPVKYFRDKIYPFIQDKTVVAIADMSPVSGQEGQGRHTVPAQQVTAEMAEAGFKLDEEPTTLFDQYLLIFKEVSL